MAWTSHIFQLKPAGRYPRHPKTRKHSIRLRLQSSWPVPPQMYLRWLKGTTWYSKCPKSNMFVDVSAESSISRKTFSVSRLPSSRAPKLRRPWRQWMLCHSWRNTLPAARWHRSSALRCVVVMNQHEPTLLDFLAEGWLIFAIDLPVFYQATGEGNWKGQLHFRCACTCNPLRVVNSSMDSAFVCQVLVRPRLKNNSATEVCKCLCCWKSIHVTIHHQLK